MRTKNIYKIPVIDKSFVLESHFPSSADEEEGKKREKEIATVAQESYQRGWNEALKKNQEDVELLCQSLKKAIEDLKRERDTIWGKSEREIIKLTFAIAKKTVLEEISQNSSKIIESVVTAALNKVKENKIVKIYVNSCDVEKLREMKVSGILNVNGNYEIVSDTEISRGGCKVVTDCGGVDARVETRWGELISALEEHNLETEGMECQK